MKYKYVVIGAGAAGLVVAIGLAKAKKKVILIENNQFGGDCTNFGCIPSKALIASSKIANNLKRAHEFGLDFHIDYFDANKSLQRVRDIIENVRSKEDAPALEKIGIDTLKAKASFKTDKIIEAIDDKNQKHTIVGKKIIIATGTSPFIPPISGLENIPFDTNETIFNLKEIPPSLCIIGAGAIGSELGQAFQRLGSQVTIIDVAPRLLVNESFETSKVMIDTFIKEGLKIHLNSTVQNVTYSNDTFDVFIKNNKSGYINQIKSQKLLLATGRVIAIKDLKLENADIQYSKKGILVDHFARTNKKHIFAIGDCIGAPFFTHKAESMARSVLFSLLVPFVKKKICLHPMPRVTFTDPEIASIGLSEEKAIEQYGEKKVAIYFVPLEDLDRAIVENETQGFVKIITHKWSSEIIGTTIVSKRAGEMLSEILVAMKKNIKLRSLSDIIHPYPTYSLGIRKAADKYLTQTIFKRRM
ncbi:MAG: Mercuric reductase [Candidatus Anoxychlamydiales bacterium]|nr:Mercuric reductase [Candidatus Anoxychlamydiales bacterium]